MTKLLWLQSVGLISDSVGLEVTFRFPGHGRIIDRTLYSDGIAMAITIAIHLLPRSTSLSLCGNCGSGAADPCNFVATTGKVCGPVLRHHHSRELLEPFSSGLSF